jgi:hypothetical protein
MLAGIEIDCFVDASVHGKIRLLVSIHIQHRDMDSTLHGVFPDRGAHGFAIYVDLSRQADVYGKQFHWLEGRTSDRTRDWFDTRSFLFWQFSFWRNVGGVKNFTSPAPIMPGRPDGQPRKAKPFGNFSHMSERFYVVPLLCGLRSFI